jgi:hypothetical protein
VVASLASPPAQLPSVPPMSSSPLRAPPVHRTRWHTGQGHSGVFAVKGWWGGCWSISGAVGGRWGAAPSSQRRGLLDTGLSPPHRVTAGRRVKRARASMHASARAPTVP